MIINASEQSIHGAKIKILIEENKENINVSVSDYGYPRNSANPDEIFEEDYIKNNRLRKVGFSIELNNCRKIIEAHNGRINAQNIENEGNRIIFSLPVQS